MTLPGATANSVSILSVSILIVEGDQVTRELYERELSRVYRVIACAGEDEARSALAREQVQAVIVEPTLLADDDWSFIAQLRDEPARADLKVVICSTLDARRRGLEMGVDAYLVKPVLPSELLAALTRALSPLSESLLESEQQDQL